MKQLKILFSLYWHVGTQPVKGRFVTTGWRFSGPAGSYVRWSRQVFWLVSWIFGGVRPISALTLFSLLSLAPTDDRYGNPPGSALVVTRIPPLFVSWSAADSIAGGFWLFIVFFPRDFPLGAETEH